MKEIFKKFGGVTLHDGEAIFFMEGANIRARFNLGECHYLWSKSFFSFIPNYDYKKDGEIELEVIFNDVFNFNSDTDKDNYHLEPMIISVLDYDDYDDYLMVEGFLDDVCQSYIKIEFRYKESKIFYWFDNDGEFWEFRKTYKKELGGLSYKSKNKKKCSK